VATANTVATTDAHYATDSAASATLVAELPNVAQQNEETNTTLKAVVGELKEVVVKQQEQLDTMTRQLRVTADAAVQTGALLNVLIGAVAAAQAAARFASERSS